MKSIRIQTLIIILSISALVIGGAAYFGYDYVYSLGKNRGFADAYLDTHIKFFNFGNQVKISKKSYTPSFDVEIYKSAISINGQHLSSNYDAFGAVLRKIHVESINYLALRLDLTDDEHSALLYEYEQIHDQKALQYFEKLNVLNKTIKYNDTVYFSKVNIQNAENLSNLIASRICNLISTIVTIASIKNDIPFLNFITGVPCNYVLSEVIEPFEKKLKYHAGIEDYKVTESRFNNRVKQSIMEFSSIVHELSVTNKSTFERDIFWGAFTSKAELTLRADARIKAGYKLDKFFAINVDFNSGIVLISLPKPEITAFELTPEFEKIENGWFKLIGVSEINSALEDLKYTVGQESYDANIMDQTQASMEVFLGLTLIPFISNLEISDVKIEYLSDSDIKMRKLSRPKLRN